MKQPYKLSRLKKVKLCELCTKIGSGATPRGGDAVYKSKGISLIRSQNILDFTFSTNGLAFIDEQQAKELANVEVKERDVLLNITGDSVARISQVPNEILPARVNQHVAIIRANQQKLNPEYLKYYLLSKPNKEMLLSLASTGATRKAITKAMIEEFEIEIPDEDGTVTQTRIASILSPLDDKIELNRRTNHTLEQIAQILFKKYFVDDIDPENLPEAWRWGKLGEIYKTTSGGTPSRAIPEYYEDGNIGWVKSKELDGGFILDTEEKITANALKNSSAKWLPVHSVLVAMYGATVGEIATLSIEATCNQAICAVLPNEDYSYTFILQFLKFNKEELINRASGSAQQNISQLVIQNFELAIPPAELVKEFHQVVENLFLKIESNLKENKYLINIRDSVLPKLMSGEIEIKEVEEELATA